MDTAYTGADSINAISEVMGASFVFDIKGYTVKLIILNIFIHYKM